jgi:DNA-binding transcriptional LysR family regulator
MEFSDRIGRRMKLHDIHVFLAVVQAGSMGKAAALLNTTQSAISRSIADLENTMGVQLFDRSPKGIETTQYGRALLKRSIAVFDELKQSVRDIEFLADPTTGEISIACSSAIAFTFIPHVMERFVKKYPRVVLQFDEVASASATRNFPELRDRKYDLILTRGLLLPTKEQSSDDLNVETLFDDPLVIAAGIQSKWAARRRKIDLAELVNEPWIMQPPQTWNYQHLAEVFHARGLPMPKAGMETLSMPVITHFLASGQFIAAMPKSVVHFNSLKVLPVDFPARPWPVNVVTLRNRTLSPVVARFIECAREVAKSIPGRQAGHSTCRRKPSVRGRDEG